MTPVRFGYEPRALTITAGDIGIGPDFTLGLSVAGVRLDRLLRNVSYFSSSGPSLQMQQLWDNNCKATERSLESLQQQVTFLSTVVSSIQQAQQSAAQANQGVASLSEGVSLTSSRTDPVDGLLTATSDGVIAVSAHNRVYTYGTTETSVAVDAGGLSGFAPGSFVRVYYNDAAREGGSVTYEGTTNEVTQTGAVHVVGGVSIPHPGSPPASGTGTTPPGYVREQTVGEGGAQP